MFVRFGPSHQRNGSVNDRSRYDAGMSSAPVLLVHPHTREPQWIVRQLRTEGRPIPRWVWATGEERAAVGCLSVEWQDSALHRRRMKLARFVVDREDALPPLRDVTIVRMVYGDLTITGFETIRDHDFAQTWYCRIAREGWEQRGKPDDV